MRWAPLLVFAVALPAHAEDRSVMGDWRYVGRDPQHVYAWNAPGLREAAGTVVVQLMRAPLAGGDFDHEIVTMQIDCAARSYRVVFATRYDAEGRAPPMEIIDGGPYLIEAGPLTVVEPLACHGSDELQPRDPVSAASFAADARDYVSSGTAAWVEEQEAAGKR